MPNWLISIPAFIVAIGILVAVHEFGHFWVARRMGVKVLRYSIGFGPRLWGRTGKRTGTEYWLSAIPLGGYVKMLDEREGPVAPQDLPYAFNRQSVPKRMAIVAAGPGINLVFAIVAYWAVFMIGVPGIKPLVGEVPAGTPAATAGLHAGDRVLSVAGQHMESWQDVRMRLLDGALAGHAVSVTVADPDGARRSLTLPLSGVSGDPEKMFDKLGLQSYQPKGVPVIAKVLSGSAAAAAGLQAGDRVLAANGDKFADPQAFVNWIQAHPGKRIRLQIKRDGAVRTLPVTLAHVTDNGHSIGRLGAQISIDASQWKALRTVRRFGPLAAIPPAVQETWSITSLTGRLLWRMLLGQVSWHNISGPIQIADYAGKTASIGPGAFLSFLALVSISLAVLNLLPVPVLDGGHLLYYGIELIRGRPLSDQIQAAGQQLGMVALLLLMGLAFYNDILRLFG